MKTILFFLFVSFVCNSCFDDHRRPHRDLEKKKTMERSSDCPPCPECPKANGAPVTAIVIPDSDNDRLDKLMAAANKAGTDSPEHKALWEVIYEKYPEVQEGQWTLYQKSGVTFYIIKK